MPVASASTATMPNVSKREGTTATRAAASSSNFSRPATQPTNRIRSPIPSRSARACSASSSGPVPATTSVPATCEAASAQASSSRSRPFCAVSSRPTNTTSSPRAGGAAATVRASGSTPLPMTSIVAPGLSRVSRSATPRDIAIRRRWLRTPTRSTRSTGTRYSRAFSRALSHCTIPTVGVEVHHGTPIEENGAQKSSTTRSAAADRTRCGAASTYPASRPSRVRPPPSPMWTHVTLPSPWCSVRSRAPGNRVVSTVTR